MHGNDDGRSPGILSAAFRDTRIAEQAMDDLRSAGFERIEISSADAERDAGDVESPAARQNAYAATFFKGHESTASSFVGELKAMGFADGDAHDLVATMTGGGAIVTADAASDQQRAIAILTDHSGDIRYAMGSGQSPTDAAAVIALREERLDIQKHSVKHGEARIHKEVVTHLESIEVPVSREELVIEQVSFDEDGVAGEIGSGDVIRIPLSQEVVNVTKTVAATENIQIGKRLVEETEHVSEITREERLRVSNTPIPPAGDR